MRYYILVISTIIYQQVHVPLTHSLLHSTKTDLAKIQFSNWPLHFTRHALSHFICLFLLEQSPLVGFWCFFWLQQGPLVGLWCFWCFFCSSKVPWWVKPLLAGTPLLCNVKMLPGFFFNGILQDFPELRCR